jgi:glycosyltransferase involved in cell wall biosynthesis
MQGRHLLQRIGARCLPRRASRLPFEKTLAHQARTMLFDRGFQRALAEASRTDDKIFLIVSGLVNRIFAHYVERLSAARSLDVVRLIKEVVALVSSNVFVSLPYLVSYMHQSSDRLIVRDVRDRFAIAEAPKLVLVTDTLFDVNGVARTIWRMIDEARRRGIDLTVVTCLDPAEQQRHLEDRGVADLVASGRLRIFDAVIRRGLPQYESLAVRFPPFLELLKFLQEGGFTKMQISTPGTVGVAGLLAAKVLQIETASTYHTCFPEYVENYTRDISLEALAWRYMILFYHSVDEVVVPSKFIARLLHDRGLRKRKLLVLDRWVDTAQFHPDRRAADYWRRHGIAAPEVVKFVYVGRVGLEKNLAMLAEAFRTVCAHRRDAHLCIIGDGPFRAEFARLLAGLPVTFTGFLRGDELAVALASCDVKVFPSTTDTWGNAPLEAQASGLPVIVSDMGGPQELMIDEVTGLRVRGRAPQALAAAMLRLMDGATRARMGVAARAFTERNRMPEPFCAILDSAAFRRRAQSDNAPRGVPTADVAVDALPEVLSFPQASPEDHAHAGAVN